MTFIQLVRRQTLIPLYIALCSVCGQRQFGQEHLLPCIRAWRKSLTARCFEDQFFDGIATPDALWWIRSKALCPVTSGANSLAPPANSWTRRAYELKLCLDSTLAASENMLAHLRNGGDEGVIMEGDQGPPTGQWRSMLRTSVSRS